MKTVLQEFSSNKFVFNHYLYVNPKPDFENVEMHTHNLYEILYFLHGDAVFVIEDRQYRLQQHDLVLISKNKGHYIKIMSDEKYERFDLLFKANDLSERLLNGIEELGVVNCKKFPEVLECLQKFDYFRSRLSNNDFVDIAFSLLKQFLYSVYITTFGEKNQRESLNVPKEIRTILNFINDNLFTISSIDEMCSQIYISKGYFFKVFKRYMKISPKKYIIQKRLCEAQRLLREGQKPVEVAYAVGFNAYSNFFRNFVGYFGYNPSYYYTDAPISVYGTAHENEV